MRVTRKPNVTAGLKWPPEMCPTAEAITPIASPCASAITVRFPPCVAMIEPAPTKISVNVPTNSAIPRCSGADCMQKP